MDVHSTPVKPEQRESIYRRVSVPITPQNWHVNQYRIQPSSYNPSCKREGICKKVIVLFIILHFRFPFSSCAYPVFQSFKLEIPHATNMYVLVLYYYWSGSSHASVTHLLQKQQNCTHHFLFPCKNYCRSKLKIYIPETVCTICGH